MRKRRPDLIATWRKRKAMALRTRLCVVPLVLMAVGCSEAPHGKPTGSMQSAPVRRNEPAISAREMVERAATLSDTRLANVYLDGRRNLTGVKLARAGKAVVIRTPEGAFTIDANNAESMEKWFSQIQAGMEELIRERGVVDIQGSYQAQSLPACREAGVAAGVLDDRGGEAAVTIEQMAPQIVLSLPASSGTVNDARLSQLSGVAVRRIVVLEDNASVGERRWARLAGVAAGPLITLRPLDPPVAECVITLTRRPSP